ncbi:Serine dehydratase alpha chain [Bacillus sp. OV166]|nr:Serine dehydratase alpha chain [Bacillus sp. OV166]
MEIRSMNELIDICIQEKKTIGEIMLMIEVAKTGKDQETITSMMEERLIKMKEAVDSAIVDTSTAPSGISGGDAVKMKDYVNQGKALTGHYIRDAMTFSLATSECNARMGVIVATPTAGAAGILPGALFSLHKNDGTSYKDLVMGLFTASALGYIFSERRGPR